MPSLTGSCADSPRPCMHAGAETQEVRGSRRACPFCYGAAEPGPRPRRLSSRRGNQTAYPSAAALLTCPPARADRLAAGVLCQRVHCGAAPPAAAAASPALADAGAPCCARGGAGGLPCARAQRLTQQ